MLAIASRIPDDLHDVLADELDVLLCVDRCWRCGARDDDSLVEFGVVAMLALVIAVAAHHHINTVEKVIEGQLMCGVESGTRDGHDPAVH